MSCKLKFELCPLCVREALASHLGTLHHFSSWTRRYVCLWLTPRGFPSYKSHRIKDKTSFLWKSLLKRRHSPWWDSTPIMAAEPGDLLTWNACLEVGPRAGSVECASFPWSRIAPGLEASPGVFCSHFVYLTRVSKLCRPPEA